MLKPQEYYSSLVYFKGVNVAYNMYIFGTVNMYLQIHLDLNQRLLSMSEAALACVWSVTAEVCLRGQEWTHSVSSRGSQRGPAGQRLNSRLRGESWCRSIKSGQNTQAFRLMTSLQKCVEVA